MPKYILKTVFLISVFLTNAQVSWTQTSISYGCTDGPGGCQVAIDYIVENGSLDANDFPVPFSTPINDAGQFRTIVKVFTRDDAGISNIQVNGVAGTQLTVTRNGGTLNSRQLWEVDFASGAGNAVNITFVHNGTSAVEFDDLPGVEIVNYRCAQPGDDPTPSTLIDANVNVFPSGVPNSNPSCYTVDVPLVDGSCNQDRDVTVSFGEFNVHQDNPDPRLAVYRFVPDDGAELIETYAAPDNNSVSTFTVPVGANATSIQVTICSWSKFGGPWTDPGFAWPLTPDPTPPDFEEGDRGPSTTLGSIFVQDNCAECSLVTCTNPTSTATAANATCNGATANSDVSITIAGFTNERYQYSTGGTFNSGSATPGSITAIPAGGVIVNNLPNTAATYTVRIYDETDDNCFVDRVVNTSVTDCTVPCVTPDAGADFTICLPKNTLNLADAPAGQEWVAATGNPAAAAIDANTGEITGLTATGVYTFTLQQAGDPTCSNDMTVTVTDGDAPNVLCNDGSTSVTLEAPANLTNVVWYSMDGTEVGTGNSLIVTSNTGGLADGTEAYYYIGEDGTASGCEVELCCPVKFITQDCCPTPNCASVTVIKN